VAPSHLDAGLPWRGSTCPPDTRGEPLAFCSGCRKVGRLSERSPALAPSVAHRALGLCGRGDRIRLTSDFGAVRHETRDLRCRNWSWTWRRDCSRLVATRGLPSTGIRTGKTAAQDSGAAGRAAPVTHRTTPASLVARRGPDAW
jgi:hypothetical protein